MNAPYAGPAPQLQIRSVRDRLYRGPCRTWDEIAPTVEEFTSRKAQLADRLVNGLAGENKRWSETIRRMEDEAGRLVRRWFFVAFFVCCFSGGGLFVL